MDLDKRERLRARGAAVQRYARTVTTVGVEAADLIELTDALDIAEARVRALREVLEHAYAMLGPNEDLAMCLPDDWDERLRLGENPLLDEIVAALAASTNEEQ